MKKIYLLLLFCLSTYTIVSAADKFWVGPINGNWNNDLNWSLTSGGVGGAGKPNSTDAVIFNGTIRVNVDISPTVFSLRTTFGSTNAVLFTSTGAVITVLNSLRVEPLSVLKDSTHGNVPFNIVLNGISQATAFIYGDWIFEGDTQLSGAGSPGAGFTAGAGSLVTVAAILTISTQGGRIIARRNSGTISSTAATLKFSYSSTFVLDNNLNAVIPLANWAKDSVRALSPYDGVLGASASTIMISGNMGLLQFSGIVPNYGRMVIDLPGQTTDASLSLPDGSKIRGNLEILNTNNHTVTLLANTSATSSVQVELGTIEAGTSFGGLLIISGSTTKVALAHATVASPGTYYKLLVNKSYSQSGGNFSLQDYNSATGSSILSVKNDFIQTGGSFITNSTSVSAAANFMLVMDDPNFIVGPSGGFFSSRILSVSSGTIDNGNHMVTLRVDHSIYSVPGFESLQNGVLLQSPLEVGRLELVRSPLTTTALNIITVTDPSPNAITIGSTGRSYVNGPLRRATNSSGPYVFPTGKGNSTVTTFIFDSCVVVPVSGTSSLYQAEYFKTGYPDLTIASPLGGVSHTEYWDIARISGSDAQVKLSLNAAVVGASATDGLVVSHFETGKWVTENGSVLTPGTSTSGSVLSKTMTMFGPFTFGYANPATLPAGTSSGLSYKYYEGSFNMLPDFSTLIPVETGTSANIDIGIRPAAVNDGFAFMWQGTINITTPGIYTFETVSDDGSKLYFNSPYGVNAAPLVNNDGTHPLLSKAGTINISSTGSYPITITFFENYGGEGMQVYWTGPGIPRQLIPNTAFAPGTPSPTSGLNYKYYEGDFNILPDFTTLIPIKTGSSANADISVRPEGVDDHFAFIWQGYISIPAAGDYTFETISDDGSKIYFNMPYFASASSLVNNDGVHAPVSATGTVSIATAGVYPITITFFEKTEGETMQLFWAGPGIPRQLIPDAAFRASATVSGLSYKYYEGDFNALPDFTTMAPVSTGTTANVNISVRPAGVNDHFAFIWQGYIHIPAAGDYTFETISDDGSKIYFNTPYSINSSSLVNNDGLHAPLSATGTISVSSAGDYPITITFFEKDGGEIMQMYWTGPGISRQLIPDAAFTTTSNGIASTSVAISNMLSTGSHSADLPDYEMQTAGIRKIYPNPFAESFTIEYYNPGKVKNKPSISLYDLKGRLIYTYQPGTLADGYNKLVINLAGENLAEGVYVGRLSINGIPTSSVKLVKTKR